jgi:hypothetical protein
MKWDKKHYAEVKEFVSHQVGHRPWCYDGDFSTWLTVWTSMIQHCIHDEDYEGAQATKDAITEFLNKHLPEVDHIHRDAIIRLPDVPRMLRKN